MDFVRGFCAYCLNMALCKKANMKNIEACQMNNLVFFFFILSKDSQFHKAFSVA